MSPLSCDTPKGLHHCNLLKTRITLLFVLNRLNLARLKSRAKPAGIDLRGTPIEVCVCGSLIFKVVCMFEDKTVSLYFTDAECALCGALVTVPTPVDAEVA